MVLSTRWGIGKMTTVKCNCYRSSERTPKENKCHGAVTIHDDGEITIVAPNHKFIKNEHWEGRVFTTRWKGDKGRLVCPNSEQVNAFALKLVGIQLARGDDYGL